MKTSKKNLEKELNRLAEAFPLAKGSLTATHSPCTRRNCKLCAEGKHRFRNQKELSFDKLCEDLSKSKP